MAELADRERTFLLTALGALPEVREADVVFLACTAAAGRTAPSRRSSRPSACRYTGSGPLGSGIAMDKDVSKRLFRDAGVPTADGRMAPVSADVAGKELGWPMVVKPSQAGLDGGPDRGQAAGGFRAGGLVCRVSLTTR